MGRFGPQREGRVRAAMARYSQAMWQRGWVANHDGNLSARLARGRLLCTPTGRSKIDIDEAALLVVDERGKLHSGSGRPFSELNLHLAWYHARADIGAVVHAHPVTATGFGVAATELEHPFLPEAAVSLGADLPLVPLALPGNDAAQAIAPYLDDHDALMLQGNGVICCGDDLEQAFLRLELVEHLCRIALVARQLGGVRKLPQQLLAPLLAARERAGLGRRGDGAGRASPTRSSDRPPRPPAAPSAVRATTIAAPDPQLEQIVREEITRVLGSGSDSTR